MRFDFDKMIAIAGPTFTGGRTRVHRIRRRLIQYGYDFVWEWQAHKDWVTFTDWTELEKQWRTWMEAKMSEVILGEP